MNAEDYQKLMEILNKGFEKFVPMSEDKNIVNISYTPALNSILNPILTFTERKSKSQLFSESYVLSQKNIHNVEYTEDHMIAIDYRDDSKWQYIKIYFVWDFKN